MYYFNKGFSLFKGPYNILKSTTKQKLYFWFEVEKRSFFSMEISVVQAITLSQF